MIAAAAVLGSVIGEGLAVYVLAELLAAGYPHGEQRAIAAWLFVAVALASFGTPRVVEFLALSRRAASAAIAATAFVVLYGALRLQFAHDVALWDFRWVAAFMDDADATMRQGSTAIIGVLLLLGLWVRAAIRARDDVELEWIPRVVSVPFAAVTMVVVFAAATDRSGEVARAGAAFYAVAVLTLAFSQLALSGTTIGEVRAGGITATLLGVTLAATIGCVIVFGIVFAVLGPLLGPPLRAVTEWVLVILLTPPAWLLAHLFELLFGGVKPAQELLPATQQAIGNTKEPAAHNPSTWARVLTYVLRGVALVVFTAVVAGVVLFFTRLRRRVRERDAARPVTGTAGSLGDDARNLLRSLFRRGGTGGVHGQGIYQLYGDVLRRAADHGRQRLPGQTASEFAPALSATFHTPVTDEITAAFEQARYAGREPDARKLAELERRWQLSV
jgi:hypothetical protein